MSNRHAAVLDNLGGVGRISMLLGLQPAAVRQWRYRGIPPKHWHRIAALSGDITSEWLARTKPRDPRSKPRK